MVRRVWVIGCGKVRSVGIREVSVGTGRMTGKSLGPLEGSLINDMLPTDDGLHARIASHRPSSLGGRRQGNDRCTRHDAEAISPGDLYFGHLPVHFLASTITLVYRVGERRIDASV